MYMENRLLKVSNITVTLTEGQDMIEFYCEELKEYLLLRVPKDTGVKYIWDKFQERIIPRDCRISDKIKFLRGK